MSNLAHISVAPSLEQLAAAWLDAKAAEQAAIERRREIDARIACLMLVKDEGTSSDTFGAFKVSVTNKLTRTLDGEAVREHWNELPELARDAFRWKPELDMKHYRALESANPAVFATVSRFVTAKPATPAVKVERVEEAA